VLELRQGGQLLGLVPTTASLMKRGLAEHSSILYEGELPKMTPRSQFLKVLRWWLCSLVFCAASWLLLMRPLPTLSAAPSLFSPGNTTIMTVLPPHPTTLADAFKLGGLHQQLHQYSASQQVHKGDKAPDFILSEAATLVGRTHGGKPLTISEFDGMLQEIVRIESRVSIVTSVRGFFTFINTMWLLAIVGISVSIGPSLYHVLKPVRDILQRVCRWMADHIIVPIARRLHEWGVFEMIAYYFCWLLVAQGYRMTEADAGIMVTVSGSLVVIPAFGYSTLLWAGRHGKSEDLKTLMPLWLAVCWMPSAIHFQSTLLGYMVVLALFSALGFGVTCHGLCYLVGFKSESAMQRVCASSLALVIGFTALRANYHVPATWLEPFLSPISIVGNIMLFLSLLIMSSRYYFPHRGRDATSYLHRNLAMMSALASAQFFGHTLGLQGMANTSTTFTVLYVLEKYGEWHVEAKLNGWLLMLGFSLVAYRCALWLHLHPEFVASIFTDH